MLVLGLLVVLIIILLPIHLLIRNMYVRVPLIVLIAIGLFFIPGQTTALLAILLIATEAIIDIVITKIAKFRNSSNEG